MEDVFVTVLWHSRWDDSEPLGVFESNAKTVAYLRETYGDWPELTEITDEVDEFEITPPGWDRLDGHLVLQRFELNTAVVVNPPNY